MTFDLDIPSAMFSSSSCVEYTKKCRPQSGNNDTKNRVFDFIVVAGSRTEDFIFKSPRRPPAWRPVDKAALTRHIMSFNTLRTGQGPVPFINK